MGKSKTTQMLTFPAEVAQVRTLADGGLRVVLDLPENEVKAAAILMECKREGIPLKVTVQAV